jgi:hypothetical protein
VAYEIVFWPTASINDQNSVKFGKTAFDKHDVSVLGRQTAYGYVPEDTTSVVLLR